MNLNKVLINYNYLKTYFFQHRKTFYNPTSNQFPELSYKN